MSTFPIRTVVTSAIIWLVVVPAHAHHGNQFLSRAIEATATEIRLGTIAAEKTRNRDVKAFALTVITDQNEALRKLMDLRAARTMIRATPVSANGFVAQIGWGMDRIHRSAADIPMTPDHRRTVERLSSVSPHEADRQFLNEIIRDHRETIAFFEEQTHVHGNSGDRHRILELQNSVSVPRIPQDYTAEDLLKDLDTVDFAIGSLPVLRLRLKQAEALQKLLQKR